MNKCLYCYGELIDETDQKNDFHKKCSKKFFASDLPPNLPYSLNDFEELALNSLQRGISLTGVQAKLSVEIEKQKNANRLTVLGALGGSYILKPTSTNFNQLPENEHLSMRLAELFKITVVPSSLIRMRTGEFCYLTKRIDRNLSMEKIHMIDFFQITEAFDKYKSSYEKIAKALLKYSDQANLDAVLYFELVLFSFLIGNNDMHLKNFSMIFLDGKWKLSAAYDLLNVSIILPEDTDELALTLQGKKSKLKKEQFNYLAKELGLSEMQISKVFKRFTKLLPEAKTLIKNSFLDSKQQELYFEILTKRAQVLELE